MPNRRDGETGYRLTVDTGFDFSVLSKFRERLLSGAQEQRLFEQMLAQLRQAGLLKSGGQQRTDATHIMAAVRSLNRLELVGEALRQALNALAVVAPEWLQSWVPAEWFEQYSVPINEYRLPSQKPEREKMALAIGKDGLTLLERVYGVQEMPWLGSLPAVETLRRIWIQQYYQWEEALCWRKAADTPPQKLRIATPFDLEARHGKKRDTQWLGYKVHLTETCSPDAPHLITQVETRPANQQDGAAIEAIQQALEERRLLPAEQLVDTAYTSAEQLVRSRRGHQVELVGPVMPDTSWQAQEQNGYDLSQFDVDWERHVVTCPQGKQSRPWKETTDRHGKRVFHATFSSSDCSACSARALCTRSQIPRRSITLRSQEEQLALWHAREQQETAEFKEKYAKRAGVEGVISQAVYVLGMRRSRYRGLAKTHFQHLVTSTAINLKRAVYWLMGIPCITTRTSSFAALGP